ncbi:TPM domain-containing protein [Aurantibacter sp.]|uniref:TPM domain-containing protein n=1 Tax=Aurantibacter sp. TaxID=2807103 RepID=UPI0035C7FE7D
MSNKVEQFLTATEEQTIVDAIIKAEQLTSGEIRVHIEANCNGNIDARIIEIFETLQMHQTAERNGVIIYVAVLDKAFAIYGDDGINRKVDLEFWNSTKDIMQNHFKSGEFTKGITQGIIKAGEELSRFFPCLDSDTDELPNTISKG